MNSPSAEHWGGDLSPTPCRRRRLRISQLLGPKHFHVKLFSSYGWVGAFVSAVKVGTFATHVTPGNPPVPELVHQRLTSVY